MGGDWAEWMAVLDSGRVVAVRLGNPLQLADERVDGHGADQNGEYAQRPQRFPGPGSEVGGMYGSWHVGGRAGSHCPRAVAAAAAGAAPWPFLTAFGSWARKGAHEWPPRSLRNHERRAMRGTVPTRSGVRGQTLERAEHVRSTEFGSAEVPSRTMVLNVMSCCIAARLLKVSLACRTAKVMAGTTTSETWCARRVEVGPRSDQIDVHADAPAPSTISMTGPLSAELLCAAHHRDRRTRRGKGPRFDRSPRVVRPRSPRARCTLAKVLLATSPASGELDDGEEHDRVLEGCD